MQIKDFNKIISANWKMNGSRSLINDFRTYFQNIKVKKDTAIIVFPPYTYIDKCISFFKEFDNIFIGAQDCSQKDNSSRTGDISSSILKDIGCEFVIIGHSERRNIFFESETIIHDKISRALEQNLKIIYCIGENEDQKNKSETFNIIKKQLFNCLNELCSPENTIIAYEPVWAIGTGKYPDLKEIEDVNDFIHKTMENEYNFKNYGNFKILYGGSVNETNSDKILSSENIDGVLVGNASLKIEKFEVKKLWLFFFPSRYSSVLSQNVGEQKGSNRRLLPIV